MKVPLFSLVATETEDLKKGKYLYAKDKEIVSFSQKMNLKRKVTTVFYLRNYLCVVDQIF